MCNGRFGFFGMNLANEKKSEKKGRKRERKKENNFRYDGHVPEMAKV